MMGLVFSRTTRGQHFREIADRHSSQLSGILTNTKYWGLQKSGSGSGNRIAAQSEIVLIGWNQIRGAMLLAASLTALAMLLLITEIVIYLLLLYFYLFTYLR